MVLVIRLRKWGAFLFIALLMMGALPQRALADSACTATVSPSTVSPGSEVVLQYDIQNTGTQPIRWISVTQPDINYSVNGISQDNWVDATSDTGTTLTGSSIAPGDIYSFQLAMQTGPSEEPAANWNISTSQNGDGSSSAVCDGQLATAIANPQAPPTPNGESGVGLTHLSATTASVSWTSAVASTSYVYYGHDAGYGKTATVAGIDTAHTVVLSGLQPNTVYHYQVAGSDGNGGNFFSDDNTFVTPEAPVVVPPTYINVPGSAAVNPGVEQPFSPLSHTAVIVPPTPHDVTPPTVTLLPFTHKPYLSAPLLHISAHDNGALARVDYSTDGGLNWLPATLAGSIGKQDETASFTPTITEDGNYQIMARAIDSNGNVAVDGPQTLVIDQIPPRFGNLVVSFGSQLLQPDSNDSMTLASRSAYKVTGDVVGGATAVELIAKNAAGRNISFAMAQNQSTGLWTGAMSFAQAGIYHLSVHTIDGAANETRRDIGQVSVVPTGRVSDQAGKQIKAARITLHYLEPSTQRWTVWDGQPYGQTNPQPVNNTNYSLMVPAGEYYMEASAPGYGTVLSCQFNVDSPQSLSLIFQLHSHTLFHMGKQPIAFPSWNVTNQAPVRPIVLTTSQDKLIGTKLPSISLAKLSGGTLLPLDLNGRPTVVSLINTWSPSGIDQLSSLQRASQNQNVNVEPLFEGERPDVVRGFLQQSGLTLDGLADPTNLAAEQVTAGFGPKHLFIDRSGHIKKVMVGVLSEEAILRELGGL
jgi:hypothetical protein